MSSKNEVCTWDFTCGESFVAREKIEEFLKKECKKWKYQLEQGRSGYRHYQGRISLKCKTRNIIGMICKECCWSITSKDNINNFYYVEKEESRIEGPWCDTDEVIYIPRQIREIEKLYPWQQTIVDRAYVWDTRSINYIYCPEGNKGKSTLCGYIRAHKIGRALPPMNDMKDIMRMVCDVRTERLYLFDMPRCMKKDKLFGFYSGVEMLKDGYAYDDRNSFREKVFDCPNIYIFSNTLPDFNSLSSDRWKVYNIVNNELKLIEAQ